MDPRYPIGKFSYTAQLTPEERNQKIDAIEELPEKLKEAVAGLSDDQLDTPYREGGWTVRQLVHHIADSHINSYVRFRLALTEEEPRITAYSQDGWAGLVDAKSADVSISLNLLTALHQRWVIVLRSLSNEDCLRTLLHPEQGVVKLDRFISLYAWHCVHHVAHITSLRERMGW